MGDRISQELNGIRMELRSIAELLKLVVDKKEEKTNDELPAGEDHREPV